MNWFGAFVLFAVGLCFSTELTSLRGHVRLTESRSPYVVPRSLVLSMSDTLTVEPGVEIRVAGYYKLMLRGTVRILGTDKKPVRILSDDSSASWVGLHISSGSNPVRIQGMEIRNAFRNTFSSVQGEIRKSTFQGNFYAVWAENSSTLRFVDCFMTQNRYGVTVGSDSLRVEKSVIQGNTFGVWLEGSAKLLQAGNKVTGNSEVDLSSPQDATRQGLASRYSRRTLQMVESAF